MILYNFCISFFFLSSNWLTILLIYTRILFEPETGRWFARAVLSRNLWCYRRRNSFDIKNFRSGRIFDSRAYKNCRFPVIGWMFPPLVYAMKKFRVPNIIGVLKNPMYRTLSMFEKCCQSLFWRVCAMPVVTEKYLQLKKISFPVLNQGRQIFLCLRLIHLSLYCFVRLPCSLGSGKAERTRQRGERGSNKGHYRLLRCTPCVPKFIRSVSRWILVFLITAHGQSVGGERYSSLSTICYFWRLVEFKTRWIRWKLFVP